MDDFTSYHDPSQDAANLLRTERAARKSFLVIALAAAAYSVSSQLIFLFIDLLLVTLGVYKIPFILQNAMAFSLILSSVCMYIFALPIFYVIVKQVPVFPLEKKRMSILELLCIFLVSRAGLFIGSQISNVITSFLSALLNYEIPDTTQQLVTQTPVWLLTLLVVVIGPIIEELIYRKWMIDRLGAYGDVTAILFSSVLFGLGHGNFFQFAYAFLLGIVLGYMYTRTGNIWYSTGLHMLTNFLGSIAVLPLMPLQERMLQALEQVGDDANAMEAFLQSAAGAQFLADTAVMGLYSMLSWSLAIAGAVIFFIYMRRLYLKPRLLSVIGAGSMTRAAILNVGTLAFALVTVADFLLSLLPA